MLKSLHLTPSVEQEKSVRPSSTVINTILNYSKSLEVKKVKQEKILIHLN
jgi:hypothetical protein